MSTENLDLSKITLRAFAVETSSSAISIFIIPHLRRYYIPILKPT